MTIMSEHKLLWEEIDKLKAFNRETGKRSKDFRERIEKLESENYKSIKDMFTSCKQCIYKKIIERAQSFRLSHEEWVFADELKDILEGKSHEL